MRPVSLSVKTQSDEDFLTSVEAATHPGEEFNHRAHVRLAWLCLREQESLDAGLARIRELIQHYATALGAPGKYHETVTRAWAALVWSATRETPGPWTFEALLEAHPELLDSRRLSSHYTEAVLHSQEAKSRWVPPDLNPLPE
jgi:hypothetical protein